MESEATSTTRSPESEGVGRRIIREVRYDVLVFELRGVGPLGQKIRLWDEREKRKDGEGRPERGKH